MKFTDVHELPCLGGDDPAAIALYMQCMASRVEQKLNERLAAATASMHRPTGIWRNSALITGIADESTIPNLDSIFWNDPDSSPQTGSGTLDNPIRYVLPGRVLGGVYEIGLSINLVSSGAVTAGSRRIVVFSIWEPTATDPVLGGERLVQLDFGEETNTGGEFLNNAYPVLNSSLGSSTFMPWIVHGNASTLNIPAGGMTMWATLLGTPDRIEVL